MQTTLTYLSNLPTRTELTDSFKKNLDSISSWAASTGSRFCPLKTYLVIFKARNSSCFTHPLLLQNFQIPTRTSAKLLGLIFDQKLSRTPHIKILKSKCNQALSVMKFLSHPSKGCKKKTFLHLYKTLILSRLDYGVPIYNSASKSNLNPIQTQALRLATGAFRTSPKLSLCAEAAEPPLSYRRLILSSNVMNSVAQFSQIPTVDSIFFPKPPPSQLSDKNIKTVFQRTVKFSFNPTPLLPVHPIHPPRVLS